MKKCLSLIVIALSAPSLVLAQFGLNEAKPNALPSGTGATFSDKLASALGSIVGSFLAFLGIVFLILMIVGGVMWMSSAGDEKRLTKAKLMLTSAVIGLVIVLSAYAITAYLGTNIIEQIGTPPAPVPAQVQDLPETNPDNLPEGIFDQG